MQNKSHLKSTLNKEAGLWTEIMIGRSIITAATKQVSEPIDLFVYFLFSYLAILCKLTFRETHILSKSNSTCTQHFIKLIQSGVSWYRWCIMINASGRMLHRLNWLLGWILWWMNFLSGGFKTIIHYVGCRFCEQQRHVRFTRYASQCSRKPPQWYTARE